MSEQHDAAGSARAAPSLDALFARSAARVPDELALCDHDGAHFATLSACGLRPLQLTYAQADRAIDALAARFRMLGLQPGSVVALQMPNCAQTFVTMLAAMRAGLTLALMPLLWRRADVAEALSQSGARAIVVAGFPPQDGGGHHVLEAAAEVFSIRQVCGFGAHLADGISRLDLMDGGAVGAGHAIDAKDGAGHAGGAAILTFERMIDGWRMVPRSHAQVIAAGLAVFLEGSVAPGTRMLSSIEPFSLAGLGSAFVPWLLSGGTLTLAHAGDSEGVTDDLADGDSDVIVAPAPLALLIGREKAAKLGRLKQLIALWRAPEQLAGSADWTHPRAQFVDVMAFGEAGLLAATRTAAGRPALILPGLQSAPRFRPKATAIGEAAVSTRGTLLLRGPMVVSAPYAPQTFGDAPRDIPDHVDTGYRARVDARTGGIVVTAPPAGLMNVGGYRFFNTDFDRLSKSLSEEFGEVQLAALPDRTNGHRLLGRAGDGAMLREHLAMHGADALIADAFRVRRAG